MRIAHGTGPRDMDSALTLSFLVDGVFKHEKVSLDLDEMALHATLDGVRQKSATALHDIVQQDPVTANNCFHQTVRLTFSILLGCSDAANNSSHLDGFPLPADGVPCKTVPGLAGYLYWFLGITEPQLRKSLHLHALLVGLGFRDLDALLTGSLPPIAHLFVRVWRFVASICFRSPEAYAASLACPSATAALAQEPFIPVKREQHNLWFENNA